jgi:hypothetical protein
MEAQVSRDLSTSEFVTSKIKQGKGEEDFSVSLRHITWMHLLFWRQQKEGGSWGDRFRKSSYRLKYDNLSSSLSQFNHPHHPSHSLHFCLFPSPLLQTLLLRADLDFQIHCYSDLSNPSSSNSPLLIFIFYNISSSNTTDKSTLRFLTEETFEFHHSPLANNYLHPLC